MYNLLRNAAEAVASSGAAGGDAPPIRIECRSDPPRIVVADRGPGIPLALRDRLMTPFASGKAPGRGTGLGLWMARRAVEAMGGSLRLVPPRTEAEAVGAVFEIRLRPAEEEERQAASGVAAVHRPRGLPR